MGTIDITHIRLLAYVSCSYSTLSNRSGATLRLQELPLGHGRWLGLTRRQRSGATNVSQDCRPVPNDVPKQAAVAAYP